MGEGGFDFLGQFMIELGDYCRYDHRIGMLFEVKSMLY